MTSTNPTSDGHHNGRKRSTLYGFQVHSDNSAAYSQEFIQRNKLRAQWDLLGAVLTCYGQAEGLCSFSTRVVSIDHRRGTNLLVLRCEPAGRMLTFLEFDSKRERDEWHEAICKLTGQSYQEPLGLRRVKTDMVRQASERLRGLRRNRTALPDILTKYRAANALEPAQPAASPMPDQPDQAGEETRGESVSSWGPSSGQSSPDTDGSGSIMSMVLSLPCSLQSNPPSVSAIPEAFKTDGLRTVRLVDLQNAVYVKTTNAECGLLVGDQIEIDKTGEPMDAEAMTEFFRTTTEEKVMLIVTRGATCSVRSDEGVVHIHLEAGKRNQLDATEAVIKACQSLVTSCAGRRSKLLFTGIDNVPVEIDGSNMDKVLDQIRQMLTTKDEVVLNLQSEYLLRELQHLSDAADHNAVALKAKDDDDDDDDEGVKERDDSGGENDVEPASCRGSRGDSDDMAEARPAQRGSDGGTSAVAAAQTATAGGENVDTSKIDLTGVVRRKSPAQRHNSRRGGTIYSEDKV